MTSAIGPYITPACIGGLVGVFVAGMVVALAEAFPTGSFGSLHHAELAGVGLGLVAVGMAAGVVSIAIAQAATWLWDQWRGDPGTGSSSPDMPQHPWERP